MLALGPAAVAALFALWAGTFAGGATSAGAAVGEVVLLGVALAAAREWRDPLRLGWPGLLIPWALWLAMIASAWASPVERAGRIGVLFFPAFLLLAAATGRWLGERAGGGSERPAGDEVTRAERGVVDWAHRAERGVDWAHRAERGALALCAVAATVAVWGLVERFVREGERVAMPLGHHNLEAAVLVALWPAALVPLRRRGAQRLAGGATAALSALAILATGSLAGQLTLAAQLVAGSGRARRAWRLLLGLALLTAAFAVPRVERLVRGTDPSAAARLGYAAAGLRGWQERPLLGWGPGSTPWTAAPFLAPAPGRREAGEMVGDLHSLPVQIAYELGATGLALALATLALFGLARRREVAAGADRTVARAGLVGLGGLAAMSLGSAAITVTALPVAGAIAAGLALAARPAAPVDATRALSSVDEPPRRGRWALAPVWVWAAVTLVVVVPLWRAQRAYERARASGDAATAAQELTRAVELDPRFPLYRARLAWLATAPLPARAEAAYAAARLAPGAAPLWLAAGVLGREAGAAWSGAALTRACVLDPLGAMAPFQQMLLAPEHPFAPALGARALLAEPRLAAAPYFVGHPKLYVGVMAHLERWNGVDLGWRAEMVERGRHLLAAAAAPPARGARAELTVEMDDEPARSAGLYLFRRAPWPAVLATVEVRRDLLGRFDLPAAAALPTSAPFAFGATLCGP